MPIVPEFRPIITVTSLKRLTTWLIGVETDISSRQSVYRLAWSASPTNFFSPQNKQVWKAGRNSYPQALWYQKIKTSPCHILNKKSTGTTKTQRELCWQNRKSEADYFISGNCLEKVQESISIFALGKLTKSHKKILCEGLWTQKKMINYNWRRR